MLDLLMRRRAIAVPNAGGTPPLPSDYEKLEYIDTDASTYFPTGFVPSTGCKVEVVMQGIGTTSGKAGVYFGSRNGYNNKCFYLRSTIQSGSATNMTALCGFSTERTVAVDINASDKNLYGVDNGTFYINDTVLGTYTDSFSPTYEMYILSINNAGSPFQYSPIGKLYGAKIWDDSGTLIRDYTPVKRLEDNKQGVYDLVNGTFIAK